MKNDKLAAIALGLILVSSLSCTSLKNKISDISSGTVTAPNVPPFDPNGRMVSPGAYLIRIMAKDEPQLAALSSDIEAAEIRMMKQIVDDHRTEVQKRSSQVSSADRSSQMSSFAAYTQKLSAPALMFQSQELSLPNSGDGAFFGGFTGFLKGMLASAVNEGTFNKKETKTEDVPGGTSKMNAEIGTNPDGSTVFEIGIVTETEKNGIKARTELRSRIEGQDCPNAEGQLPLTIKVRLWGQSGASRFEQDVTGFIRVVVDDNAEIASETIDATQATARGRNGENVFVESSFTIRNVPNQESPTITNVRTVRQSDNSSQSDRSEAANSGYAVVLGAANGAISAAKYAWQSGACIKIDAKSPGSVEPNSSTSIPVKVVHKKEGSEVAAKLQSELKGGASIDPAVIPRTPGTLKYVAPGEAGKTATISLTANSRRGRATLDLTASTGSNSYHIVGGLDDFQTSADVCDVTKPFTLKGGGFTVQFSGGMEGTYTYTGPFNAKGDGTYKISLPDGPGKPGTMVGGGSGQITGDKVYTGSGTEKYTLTPIAPCS